MKGKKKVKGANQTHQIHPQSLLTAATSLILLLWVPVLPLGECGAAEGPESLA